MGQMQGISRHLAQEGVASQKRLALAQELCHRAEQRQAWLLEQQEQYRDRLSFTAAKPHEPLGTRIQLPEPPQLQAVVATDGSQIAPSHHEIAYCYLINIGRVAIHYGQSRYPLLDSVPEVFYQSEDLYYARQWGIRTEEWFSYRRAVSEVQALAQLATQVAEDAKSALPILALVDGSLIYWFLENLPEEPRYKILTDLLTAWEQLRALRIPLVGYVSASRNTEALNFLRLEACPYGSPDCLKHCHELDYSPPCQGVTPLRDVSLWQTLLQPGDRGALFQSQSRILQWY
ncbi:MAG: DNA double-strand break repair nuclease NurA, partial [Cyanobacteria bacterium P01_H01_bin.121]